MMRKFIAGCAAAIALVPFAAHADNSMVASEGSFELWASTVGTEKGWAVVDSQTGEAVYAEKKGGEVQILTGKKASSSLAELKDMMPTSEIVELGDGTNIRILSDNGGAEVKVLELKRDDEVEFDLEEMLEEAGVSIDGDITIDTDEGKQHIVIKTTKSTEVSGDVDVETMTDEDGKTKTEIRVLRMPEPPEAPDAAVVTGEGKSVIVKKNYKMVYDYSTDEDGGLDKSFMHMTGVSPEDAEEFIDDIEDLTGSEKQTMKEALSL